MSVWSECMFVYYMHAGALRGQKSFGSLGARVTGSCEPPDVSAKNQAQVLGKSRRCLSHSGHSSVPVSKSFLLGYIT